MSFRKKLPFKVSNLFVGMSHRGGGTARLGVNPAPDDASENSEVEMDPVGIEDENQSQQHNQNQNQNQNQEQSQQHAYETYAQQQQQQQHQQQQFQHVSSAEQGYPDMPYLSHNPSYDRSSTGGSTGPYGSDDEVTKLMPELSLDASRSRPWNLMHHHSHQENPQPRVPQHPHHQQQQQQQQHLPYLLPPYPLNPNMRTSSASAASGPTSEQPMLSMPSSAPQMPTSLSKVGRFREPSDIKLDDELRSKIANLFGSSMKKDRRGRPGGVSSATKVKSPTMAGRTSASTLNINMGEQFTQQSNMSALADFLGPSLQPSNVFSADYALLRMQDMVADESICNWLIAQQPISNIDTNQISNAFVKYSELAASTLNPVNDMRLRSGCRGSLLIPQNVTEENIYLISFQDVDVSGQQQQEQQQAAVAAAAALAQPIASALQQAGLAGPVGTELHRSNSNNSFSTSNTAATTVTTTTVADALDTAALANRLGRAIYHSVGPQEYEMFEMTWLAPNHMIYAYKKRVSNGEEFVAEFEMLGFENEQDSAQVLPSNVIRVNVYRGYPTTEQAAAGMSPEEAAAAAVAAANASSSPIPAAASPGVGQGHPSVMPSTSAVAATEDPNSSPVPMASSPTGAKASADEPEFSEAFFKDEPEVWTGKYSASWPEAKALMEMPVSFFVYGFVLNDLAFQGNHKPIYISKKESTSLPLGYHDVRDLFVHRLQSTLSNVMYGASGSGSSSSTHQMFEPGMTIGVNSSLRSLKATLNLEWCRQKISPVALLKNNIECLSRDTSSNRSDLTRHSSGSSKEIIRDSRYTCKFCQQSFKRIHDCLRHERETHGKVKLLKCPECDASFTRGSNLRRHQIAVHQKHRAFHCEICDSWFTTKANLERHTANIHQGMTLSKENSSPGPQ